MSTALDNQQHPDFPTVTVMKIIVHHGEKKEAFGRIEELFDELELPPRQWSTKYSGNNSYVSFSTEVTIESSEQLHTLYSRLGDIPGVRYIL